MGMGGGGGGGDGFRGIRGEGGGRVGLLLGKRTASCVGLDLTLIIIIISRGKVTMRKGHLYIELDKFHESKGAE